MSNMTAVLAFAALLGTAANAAAQAPSANEHQGRWGFIVNSGTVVPTGAQRAAVKRANLTAAQLSYALQSGLALTASFGWARTRDVASVGEPKLDMFTYDVGAELRASRWMSSRSLSFSPFAGAGAGGRTYNYRSLDQPARHNLAGYASAGGELGIGRRVSVRLEARDYISGFTPLAGGGPAATRNDVSLMAGLRLKVR